MNKELVIYFKNNRVKSISLSTVRIIDNYILYDENDLRQIYSLDEIRKINLAEYVCDMGWEKTIFENGEFLINKGDLK